MSNPEASADLASAPAAAVVAAKTPWSLWVVLIGSFGGMAVQGERALARMPSVEGITESVTQIQADMGEMKAEARVLETTVTGMAQDLRDLKTDLHRTSTALDDAIEKEDTLVRSNSSRIDVLEAKIEMLLKGAGD